MRAQRHHTLVFCIVSLLFPSKSLGQQIGLDVQIVNSDGSQISLDTDSLNTAASSQGAAGSFVNVDSSPETQLSALQCQQGTFSQKIISNGITTQTCVSCSAGTASAAVGASDASTCAPCTTGSFAIEKAATCTDCASNTFSITPAGPSPSVCLQCPPHTTSPTHSNSVDNCVCDAGYFQSDNVLKAFPYAAVPISLGFEGTIGINFPHVQC
jgi:hypothetical protein